MPAIKLDMGATSWSAHWSMLSWSDAKHWEKLKEAGVSESALTNADSDKSTQTQSANLDKERIVSPKAR